MIAQCPRRDAGTRWQHDATSARERDMGEHRDTEREWCHLPDRGQVAAEHVGGDLRETLNRCLVAARRLQRIVASLLTLARGESCDVPRDQQRVDLKSLAVESLRLLSPIAEEADITCELEATPLEAIGDAERLGDALLNVLDNAIRFAGRGGRVRIQIRREEHAAVIRVQDTGPGVPAEHLPQLGERFYRVEQDRSRESGGSGLGLAIVKQTVEWHGGSLSFANQAEGGLEVSITLPFKEAPLDPK
jgi:two-component system phosphate regulon sensor histidine kinase PhoR